MKLFADLYLDEDVSVLLASLLKARGLDVLTTHEHGALGNSDEDQMAEAIALRRALITHNRVDFERLHTATVLAGERHFGMIIASRHDVYEVARRIARLLDTLTADEIENQLLYI